MPYVAECLADTQGVVVAASDYLKSQPDMISRWVGRPVVDARHRRIRPQRGPRVAARLLRSGRAVHRGRDAVGARCASKQIDAQRSRQAFKELEINPREGGSRRSS